MSSRRRHGKLHLVNAWIEELLQGEDAALEQRVIERRSQRDSYSFDRPLISTQLSVSARYPILSDLRELSPLLESERLSELPRA